MASASAPRDSIDEETERTDAVAVIGIADDIELPMPNLPRVRRGHREPGRESREQRLIRENAQLRREIAELTQQVNAIQRDNETYKNRFLCIICFTRDRCVLLPCMHICVCAVCFESLNEKCPMCRGVVRGIHDVFIV